MKKKDTGNSEGGEKSSKNDGRKNKNNKYEKLHYSLRIFY